MPAKSSPDSIVAGATVLPLSFVLPEAVAVVLAVVMAICVVLRFFLIPTLHDALGLARDRRRYEREDSDVRR